VSLPACRGPFRRRVHRVHRFSALVRALKSLGTSTLARRHRRRSSDDTDAERFWNNLREHKDTGSAGYQKVSVNGTNYSDYSELSSNGFRLTGVTIARDSNREIRLERGRERGHRIQGHSWMNSRMRFVDARRNGFRKLRFASLLTRRSVSSFFYVYSNGTSRA